LDSSFDWASGNTFTIDCRLLRALGQAVKKEPVTIRVAKLQSAILPHRAFTDASLERHGGVWLTARGGQMARKLAYVGEGLPTTLAAITSAFVGKLFRLYHPERHYMRGPGPKTLEKIGAELRARLETTTKEPLPEEWLRLIKSFEAQEPQAPVGHKLLSVLALHKRSPQ